MWMCSPCQNYSCRRRTWNFQGKKCFIVHKYPVLKYSIHSTYWRKSVSFHSNKFSLKKKIFVMTVQRRMLCWNLNLTNRTISDKSNKFKQRFNSTNSTENSTNRLFSYHIKIVPPLNIFDWRLMVETLSTILLTSSELFDLRQAEYISCEDPHYCVVVNHVTIIGL